jgi:hypothetical protein
MRIYKIIELFLLAVIFTSCSEGFQGPKITDKKMQHYLSALEEIRDIDPALIKPISNLHPDVTEEGRAILEDDRVEKIVTKAGFSDVRDFKNVNGKIVSIYRSLNRSSSSPESIEQFDSVQKQDEAKLDAMLASPGLSEDAKKRIREGYLKASKAHEKSREYLEKQSHQDDSFVMQDESSVEIVKKYKDQLDNFFYVDRNKAHAAALEKLKKEFADRFADQMKANPFQMKGEVTVKVKRSDSE